MFHAILSALTSTFIRLMDAPPSYMLDLPIVGAPAHHLVVQSPFPLFQLDAPL